MKIFKTKDEKRLIKLKKNSWYKCSCGEYHHYIFSEYLDGKELSISDMYITGLNFFNNKCLYENTSDSTQ